MFVVPRMPTTYSPLAPENAASPPGSPTATPTEARRSVHDVDTSTALKIYPREVLVTTHVLSGAVLGALAPDVSTAVSRGFASHFALDAIPHWGCEPSEMLRVAVPDGLVGLAAIAAVSAAAEPSHRVRVLAGVFGACLPDIDKPCELFFGASPFPRWFDWFHGVIQHERPERWRREVVIGLCMAGVAAVVLRAQEPRTS